MENDVFKNDHKVSNLTNQVHYVALDSDGNDPVRSNFNELKKKKNILFDRVLCIWVEMLNIDVRCELIRALQH